MNSKFVGGDGVGKFMIVGEVLSADEEIEGKPFVGKSGKLLFKVLNEFNINREKDCYVTNTVKVRPDKNKVPTTEELQSWLPILRDEIYEVEPVIILLAGECAAKAFHEKWNMKLKEIRGVPIERTGDTALACYNPAFVMRTPNQINTFKNDIKIATDIYHRDKL